MVRSELAYYVPRSLNRIVPAYHTSVQFLKRTVPAYRTRTITKKAYRSSVPYFLAKIEAYRTVLTYRTVRRVARNSQWGAVWGVWGRSPQPPEANGGLGANPHPLEAGDLGAKPRAAGGTGV